MDKCMLILMVVVTLICCGVTGWALVLADGKEDVLRKERDKAVQAYESQIQDLKSQLKAAEYEVDYWRKKACP